MLRLTQRLIVDRPLLGLAVKSTAFVRSITGSRNGIESLNKDSKFGVGKVDITVDSLEVSI